MEGQNQHPIPIPGAVPPVMPRQLPPEEYEAAKEKGREWSRIVAQKRSKEFTTEQVEERKLKNRLRQKRFRERQKTREQEETARNQVIQAHQAAQINQHAIDPNQLPYDASQVLQQQAQQPQQPGEQGAQLQSQPDLQSVPTETLIDKRKRLGRERQARFREKKRQRAQGVEMGMDGMDGAPGRPVMDFADLQKLSAQLTGYYTGLTQGMMREEHTVVLRCFLEGVREELGDELLGLTDYPVDPNQVYMHPGQEGVHMQAMQDGLDGSGVQKHMGEVGQVHLGQLEYQRHLDQDAAHQAALEDARQKAYEHQQHTAQMEQQQAAELEQQQAHLAAQAEPVQGHHLEGHAQQPGQEEQPHAEPAAYPQQEATELQYPNPEVQVTEDGRPLMEG